MGDLVALETDDYYKCHFYFFPGRLYAGQHPFDDCGMRKPDHQLFDDLVFSDGQRHVDHLDVGREKFAHQMIDVKIAHTFLADSAGQERYIREMRVIGHRDHRGFDVTLEFRLDVALKGFPHRFLQSCQHYPLPSEFFALDA
jgi:hypothetical protein